MCNCFTQVSAIWRLIDWPDFIGVQMFLVETIDCLTKAAHKYATQIKENCQSLIAALSTSTNYQSPLNIQQQPGTPTNQNTTLTNASLFNSTTTSNRSLNNNTSRQTLLGAPTSSLDACQKLMIATNNLERVRESLKAYLLELDLERYLVQAEKAEKTKLFEANRTSFDVQINQASDYILAIIDYLLETIILNKVLLTQS